MKQPAEGIYRLGELDYDSIEAVNMSSLVDIAVSPKFYNYRRQVPREQTPAMQLGIATDMAVFEPERFARSYAVWTGFDEDGKKKVRNGKYWEAFQQANAGKIILTQDEYDSALNMRRVVESDPLAMSYLESGTAQDTLIWRDKETGILCKGRTDWNTSDDRLADLKTAKSVIPWQFCRDGAKLHYHVKMSWYADGLEQILGKPPREVVLISVENVGCHDVVVYDMDDEQVLDYGRSEYRTWLATLEDCLSSNKWPGIARGAKVPFVLPKYLKHDDEELDGLEFEGAA